MYYAIGDNGGMRHFWKGFIEPNSTVTLTIPTKAGNQTGTFFFSQENFIVTTPQGFVTGQQNLTVLAAATVPTMALTQPNPLLQGTVGSIWLEVDNPTDSYVDWWASESGCYFIILTRGGKVAPSTVSHQRVDLWIPANAPKEGCSVNVNGSYTAKGQYKSLKTVSLWLEITIRPHGAAAKSKK